MDGCGCPTCNESVGERIIRTYLEDNDIEYEQEHRFDDCRFKYPLIFDFYIPKLNTVIEFDGIQHFECVEHFGGAETLNVTRKRDSIKNEYINKSNMRMVRLNYKEIDMINDKLNEELI